MKKVYLCTLFLFLLISLSSNAQVPGSIIDVQHYSFAIRLNDKNDIIEGKADIAVKFLQKANSFHLDLVKKNATGKGMLVSSVTEKGNPIQFQQISDTLNIIASVSEGSRHTYRVTYHGTPADGLIISTNKFGHRTFFGDNWPNRAHNWLPCVDNIADKATVDFVVTAPAHYQVVANGLKVSETTLPGNLKQTKWKESAPLPTKVMVIGVADFAVDHTGDVNKIPVFTYVFPENKAVGFKGYAVAKEILSYYMKKVGPYAYEKLANVQSKTIFGGMENASCIFYFENSVGDKGIEELMAHEIAHQWFGDAASEKSFAHLWLSEGFATYMTNVYLESKYGTDTLKQRLEKDRKEVFEFEKQRFTPVVDTAVKDNYMQLLNANSYQKGGWVLHMLRRKMGDELFWKGIRAYYEIYDGSNANTEDLQAVMQNVYGQSLDQFFKQWLRMPGHPQLHIYLSYNNAKKSFTINIEQKQNNLYDFTLECSIDNQLHKIEVKDKKTHIEIPGNGDFKQVIFDPNVNLLGEFDMSEDE